jgi:hypothetical protein
MRKTNWHPATLGAAVTIMLAATLLTASRPFLTEGSVAAQDNALANGGFEGDYQPWKGVEVRRIAPSWNLWYLPGEPEGQRAPPHAEPVEGGGNARSGKAQGVYSDGDRNFDACLYQQIDGITPGYRLKLTAWAKVEAHDWLHELDKMQTRIGIDPAGGTDPRDINWYTHPAHWASYTNVEEWQQLHVEINATAPAATIYLCTHPSLARWIRVYWDDAEFTVSPEQSIYMPLVSHPPCWPERKTLGNPDLEEEYCGITGYQVHPGYPNITVAPWWTAYWNDDYNPDTSENRQPEYGPTDRSYRVRSGRVSQQVGISGGGAFEAGVYQVVYGFYPGDVVRFTMWGLGWNQHWSENDGNGFDERVSDHQEEGGLRFQIGIDPLGKTNYASQRIVWSEPFDPYDEWHKFEVVAAAQSYQVSVWLKAHPSAYWLRWNESFWDDGKLEVVQLPTVGFERSEYSVGEAAGPAAIIVTLDAPSVLETRVDYATSDGTATAPGDYTAVAGTLTFARGQTSAVFEVPIADNSAHEADRTVQLALSNPENAHLGGPNPVTLTILNDDLPAPAPACDASNRFCEDHDTWETAYGPLALNAPYSAYPEDAEDYYLLDLAVSTTLSVTLSDYAPTSDQGTLALYGPTTEQGLGNQVDAFTEAGQTFMALGPHTLQAGTYVVQVQTAEAAFTDTVTYTLTVLDQ